MSRPTSIPAQWPGICAECGERWQAGDLIRPGDYRGDEWPTEWQHATCPDPLQVERPPCPMCFLVHPEGACDR